MNHPWRASFIFQGSPKLRECTSRWTRLRKINQCTHRRRKIIRFKSCIEGLFCSNLNYPIMITNTTNFPLKAYSYLSTVKQDSEFLLILILKERRKLENYNIIFTGQECKILILTYKKEWSATARQIQKILSDTTTYMYHPDHLSKEE